jgi:hypothetical protein
MPKLSDQDIAEVTGRPAPEKVGATNRHEAALEKMGELASRLSELAEKHRRPDESHQQALARVMNENPRLYAEAKAARSAIIKAAGLGDYPTGGI